MQPKRKCGDCQLCCKLLPMSEDANKSAKRTIARMLEVGILSHSVAAAMTPDFDKKAGCKCPHQKFGVGCKIYNTRPFGCMLWICAWLEGADLPRPDHCHYVVDTVPDEILVQGKPVSVLQVWVDSKYPKAYLDPPLLSLIEAMGRKHQAPTMIRYNERDGFVLIPPSMTPDNQWLERRGVVDPNAKFGVSYHVKKDFE